MANAAVPLLGLVDTAVIGNSGSVEALGAIALGALVFNFVYWSFGFLRMGTTGFTAQASGAEDTAEVRATLGRALLIAVVVGGLLLLLQRPIIVVALAILGAGAEVEELTRRYFEVRIWGAPASLGMFALLGTFVGLGRTKSVLVTQLVLNGLNITLDVLFAGVLGWGVEGIALGTAIAEWTALFLALGLVYRLLQRDRMDDEPFWSWNRIGDPARVRRAVTANADILIRTLFLMLGFAWFTDQGARFGDAVLAANHVLLQLVSLSAYLLDGFAHATEIHVGRAVGAGRRGAFDQAVRSATELAAMTGVVLGGGVLLVGPTAVRLLTDLPEVNALAIALLPLAAVYVTLSFAAFQLDGIFIGATATRDMRNASVVSFGAFLGLTALLVPAWGNRGLWWAFIAYVVIRAATLGVRYGPLRRSISGGQAAARPEGAPSG